MLEVLCASGATALANDASVYAIISASELLRPVSYHVRTAPSTMETNAASRGKQALSMDAVLLLTTSSTHPERKSRLWSICLFLISSQNVREQMHALELDRSK